MVLALRPMSFAPRLVNSGSSLANAPSSVVQTGLLSRSQRVGTWHPREQGRNVRVVLWVREENDPIVANEVVEVDGTVGGLGVEVGGDAAQAERCWTFGSHYRWLVCIDWTGGGSEGVR